MEETYPVWLILAILGTHFVGDFILQSDWMASNKSKRNSVLALHVGIYSSCFLWLGPLYAGVNFLAHFATDWITSRWTSRLYKAKKIHWFFVVIGLDQLAHYAVLLWTLGIARM